VVEQLFGSKTRVKLLQLFYGNPNRAFYVREITRKVDEQINSVRRELANLLSIGIITSDTNNNRLYYEVNQSYLYFKPLRDIFGDPKASAEGKPKVRVGDPVAEQLQKLGNIDLAIYTGQFTRDTSSGVDLLLVGDIVPARLDKFIEELERSENKQINYSAFTPDEFNYRVQVKDRFINQVLRSKKQVLIDKKGALEAVA
jgi:hypothetical protein